MAGAGGPCERPPCDGTPPGIRPPGRRGGRSIRDPARRTYRGSGRGRSERGRAPGMARPGPAHRRGDRCHRRRAIRGFAGIRSRRASRSLHEVRAVKSIDKAAVRPAIRALPASGPVPCPDLSQCPAWWSRQSSPAYRTLWALVRIVLPSIMTPVPITSTGFCSAQGRTGLGNLGLGKTRTTESSGDCPGMASYSA